MQVRGQSPTVFYALFYSVLATSGLCLYMVYLWSAFDSPFDKLEESGLGRNFSSALLLILSLRLPAHNLNSQSFGVWFVLLFLTPILVHRKWLPSSLFAFNH